MQKKIIKLNGVISKENNKSISDEEYEDIMDDLIKTIEKKGYIFGGGSEVCDDDESGY